MSKSKTAFTLTIDNSNPFKAVRHTWGSFRPTERIVESKKKYNRAASKQETRRMIMGD